MGSSPTWRSTSPRANAAPGSQFIDKVVGGSVPRNFIPAVGDGAEEAARKGPFGYPVVDISVTLVDGKFHSVDSSDMAFKTATGIAMREGLAEADPVLLEPVDHVTISVPNEFTARAQRLLTGRRGQILGYAERPGWGGWDDVEALVPEAELHDLIIELRSQTSGLGRTGGGSTIWPRRGWRRGGERRRGAAAQKCSHIGGADPGFVLTLAFAGAAFVDTRPFADAAFVDTFRSCEQEM